MSTHPADFRVEIIPCRPATETAVPIDVTAYCHREGFGSVNRALERDLLSFKTGDMTLTMRNADGYFDDLFHFFLPTDQWSLRVYRRGDVQFWGVVIGKGSITFDRKAEECEITAYGLTKILDETSADGVSRGIADMTVTTATAAATTMTLNTTAGLLTGDVLHVTNNLVSEDVTVKYVASATVVNLVAALSNTYASGSPVVLTTQFYRYKTVEFLVRELFAAASIPVADLRLTDSQFRSAAPTPFSHGNLGTARVLLSGGCERLGRIYANLDTLGPYYQTLGEPDSDWTNEDATSRPWIDWSRYRKQSEGAPDVILRAPDIIGTAYSEAFGLGVDNRTATKKLYRCRNSATNIILEETTSADGTTWAAWATTSTFAFAGGSSTTGTGAEFDPVRNMVYVHVWDIAGAGYVLYSYVYDVAGASWTTISGGASPGYYGFRYVPEDDYTLAVYGTMLTAPTAIAAFRGSAVLWSRTLPTFLENINSTTQDSILPTGATTLGNIHALTHGARWINGAVYMIGFRDSEVYILWSRDAFVTVSYSSIGEPGQATGAAIPSRVNGAYYFWLYAIASPTAAEKKYYIAAPFFAGVVDYADFEDSSVADALKKLSVLVNAVFWVDDDLQGHFVARDLYDPGQVVDVGDRVMEKSETLVWDETAQFATASGGGVEATSGDDSFSSEGIELSTDLLPNEAYAQALADDYYSFYSQHRKSADVSIHDVDGRIFQPLDRITLGGPERFLVYESDHNLTDDTVNMTLLEDV